MAILPVVANVMQIRTVVLVLVFFALQKIICLHALPPIEPCPPDSIQVEDICKCNPQSCSKPPCLSELALVANGTDIPGRCCPLYSCQGCSNETLVHGQCPCATGGAILNSEGKCKCVESHKKLVEGVCVCDTDLCGLPKLCDDSSVRLVSKEDCCDIVSCIRCPEDSFPTNNEDEALEDKCVCYPCQSNQCGLNETAVVMQAGRGFPGHCCDLYRCEKEQKCVVGDVHYGDGQTWVSPDLQQCKCQNGISLCSKPTASYLPSARQCHAEGNVYEHNESWMVDSCTNCTCLDGDAKCIAHMCDVRESHVESGHDKDGSAESGSQQNSSDSSAGSGPHLCQPLKCNKFCAEGYKLNRRGCEICRCNYLKKCDDILRQYNITRDELEVLLKERERLLLLQQTDNDYTTTSSFPTSSISMKGGIIDDSTTVAAPTLNNESDRHQTTTVVMPNNDPVISWPIIFVIVFATLSAIAIMCLIIRVFRKHGNKGSYDTAPTSALQHTYERVKSKHEALINNYINSNYNNRDSVIRNN